MPRGLDKILSRIRALARERSIRFTLKAVRELAALGLDVTDACEVLAALKARDFATSVVSNVTGERLHVFKPTVAGMSMYIRLILRDGCLVVSFHEDELEHDEEGK